MKAKRLGALLGILAILFLAGTALAETFVIGPGMLGHPGDDPSVGVSALEMDQNAPAYAESAFAPNGKGIPIRPWEEQWYELNMRPSF